MKTFRAIAGYVLGGVMFVVLLPTSSWLRTSQAVLVWTIFVAIMIVQVLTEEKRLRRDFGEEYEAYCKRTGRFLPFTCK